MTYWYFSKYYDCETGIKKYKIINEQVYNYMLIKVQGRTKEANTNHIISYYQKDSDLKERKQLSQGVSSSSLMWLSKLQIENYFYMTIECAKFPCDFQLDLNLTNKAYLPIGETYTYYVTHENKQMNFTIVPSPLMDNLREYQVHKFSLWAKGQNNSETILEGGTYQKPSSKYNFYWIELSGIKQSNYTLVVKGEFRELINIGALIYEYYYNPTDPTYYCISEFNYNGQEMTNYLEKRDTNTFNNNQAKYGYPYDPENYGVSYEERKIKGYKEILYSFPNIIDTKYDGQGNNKYMPQHLGVYYYRIIEQGQTIGLIPMKVDDHFNFLNMKLFQNMENMEN